MKVCLFLGLVLATGLTQGVAFAQDSTQNAQSPEFYLQALCRGNGHLGKGLGDNSTEVIKQSAQISKPLRPGNSAPENYKIAELTYQGLSKDALLHCHEYSDEQLKGLVDNFLLKSK
ncbi:hypothetical protein F4826_003027 [Rahnella inusitata]|nr:hypothetical protein [Rahnella inusitata]